MYALLPVYAAAFSSSLVPFGTTPYEPRNAPRRPPASGYVVALLCWLGASSLCQQLALIEAMPLPASQLSCSPLPLWGSKARVSTKRPRASERAMAGPNRPVRPLYPTSILPAPAPVSPCRHRLGPTTRNPQLDSNEPDDILQEGSLQPYSQLGCIRLTSSLAG